MRIPFLSKSKSEAADLISKEDRQAVSDFIRAWKGSKGPRRLTAMAKSHPEAYERVAGLKGTDRAFMALALLEAANRDRDYLFIGFDYQLREDLVNVAGNLISAKGAVPVELFPFVVKGWLKYGWYGHSLARIVGVAENLVAEHGLTPTIEAALQEAMVKNQEQLLYSQGAEYRKTEIRLRQLLNPPEVAHLDLPEPWQVPVASVEFTHLRDLAATASTTAMSDRWAKAARPLLDEVGADRFLQAFEEVVSEVARMSNPVDTLHADMLRGLAWFAGITGTSRAASLLSRLAIACAHKIGGVGARSQKGFSGAVGALERMGTFDAIAQLSNARSRVKAPSLSAQLGMALTRAAERLSLPLADMEELVVPTYGLTLPGVRTEEFGTVEARLQVVEAVDVELRWFRDGKELKSPPAEVKNAYPEELKELKSTAKEMAVTLTGQRARIEGLMLSGRTLPYSEWRERYLEHPLLAGMTRRLIWRFADPEKERLGMPVGGEPLDVEGKPLAGLGPETTVRLWHPIHAGASAIEAWREFLIAREICQPFKQAYREIYILTDAEERTRIYSNRFAAHILKQHQLNALARQRGWRYSLQGFFDSDCDLVLSLPQWGLTAVYLVEVADVVDLPEGESAGESGIAYFVSTDQVRFMDDASGSDVPLESVPPVVFSEVMRDVDLFVGVCSVGNDPTWGDRGNQGGFFSYWHQVSFGNLSASAETRKAVLQRLLPRLAIGKVSFIEGKFLVVKGHLRTYRIHLGSGNILMEPNNQYLCIVPGFNRGKSNDRVYLPFEGDGVLAIILSKATMLANDDKITDLSITRQILR